MQSPADPTRIGGFSNQEDCMGFERIIAIDLGKFKSVACVMDAATRRQAFVTVATTPAALHELFAAHAAADPARTLLVIEACDAAGWVHDLAAALGLNVKVANCCHEAWRWRKVKRKTDRDDALKLARMALNDELPTVHVPDPQRRQRRRLIQHRRALVHRRTQCKNAIRSIFSQQGMSELLPRGTKAWTKPGIAQLREHARPLAACAIDDLWRGRLHVELELLEAITAQVRLVEQKLDALLEEDEPAKRLTSVHGVGPRLAEAVAVCLDDPRRFKSGAEVSSYAGMVPKQIESGTMKRVGRITRRGPSLLRGMLIEVAWMVYRHNAWAREFVARVSRGTKSRKKIAIVALARRLLVKLWAMLRDGTAWREPGDAETPLAT
jgi:transposase